MSHTFHKPFIAPFCASVTFCYHVTCAFRSTRALIAAAAAVCAGRSDSGEYAAAAAAADADGEAAVSCYAGLLHVTSLLNAGNLIAAQAQASAARVLRV